MPLIENMQRTIGFYNAQVLKWLVTPEKSILNIDNFVAYDDTKINWSSGLKQKLKSGQMAEFSEGKTPTCPLPPLHEVKSIL